jgi:uncharacterized protein involved in exopolysaccharide biosynthesis
LGLVMVLGLTTAVGVASFLAPKEYEASTMIEPTSDNSNSAQTGALGSLGSNLIALAGLSAGSDTKKTESVAVLQSATLTEKYIQDNNLMPILFAKQWDAAHSRWKATDPARIPTLWKTNEYFRKNVRSLTTDSKSGLLTLTITWTDPVLAANWANGLVQLANDFQRNAALADSQRDIDYLSGEAAKTDVLGIKQTIYSILEREYSKAMLAKGNNEYAFKIIDRAQVPERPTYPNKLVWILVAFFTSVSFYFFIAFCIVVWSKA